jgi:RpiB/LacA/LacB family sugar-phosphate isomerase
MAEMSRRHNDTNVLVLPGRFVSTELGLAMVRAWLEAPFDGGRHARRLEKIRLIEERLEGHGESVNQ